MASPKKKQRLPHFLTGSTVSNLIRSAGRYGGVSPAHWLRYFGLLSFATMGVPVRCYEALRYGPRIRRVEICEPVFLVGHWQSGLSPLQFLLAQDPQFAYLSTYQAAFPWGGIASRWIIRPIMKRLMRGKTRGSDSFRLHDGLPQGSDLPAATGTDLSFYHAYIFPRHAEDAFRCGVLFDGVSDNRIARWKRMYRYLMQTSVYVQNRPRALVRNSSDTGRIKYLLEEFPDAKFIHVVRNPYEALHAANERWESMCRIWAFQKVDMTAMRAHTLDFYERLMQRYYEQRSLIPASRLTEVRYEDLTARPLETAERIYRELALPGFDAARGPMETYLGGDHGSLAGHSEIDFTLEEMNRIRERLAFAFDQMGYPLEPAPLPTAAQD